MYDEERKKEFVHNLEKKQQQVSRGSASQITLTLAVNSDIVDTFTVGFYNFTVSFILIVRYLTVFKIGF